MLEELDLDRFLRSQRELAAELLSADSLDDATPGFLQAIGELLGWEAAGLWRVSKDTPLLSFVAGWSGEVGEPLWRGSTKLEIPSGTGLLGRAWETGEITAAADVTTNSVNPSESAVALGLEGALAIPIPVGAPAGVLAVAEVYSSTITRPPAELLSLLTAFADQLATFVITRQDRAEAERLRAHLAEVMRGTGDAVFTKDLDGRIISWNPAAERLFGYAAEEAIGKNTSMLVPDDRLDELENLNETLRGGRRLEMFETQRIRKDGSRIDVSLTLSPMSGAQGEHLGASVVARDVTLAIRNRRARDFLVAASRDFDSSLDPGETARNIVGSAVPELASVCVIDFIMEDGRLGESVVAAADPEVACRLEKIRGGSPLDPNGPHPAARVLRERRPMVWRDLKAPDVVDQVAQNADHLSLMVDAGYNSAAVVQLEARGRVLGALSFLHARPDLRYDAADLEFLADLGGRAAMALDNARLFRERDLIASNLQSCLRPPAPASVPGLEISVFFEAAGKGIDIGGDLYDVLPTDDGCWLLIGDVVGKGSAAAAVSIAVRHAVRGLTLEMKEPGDVLQRVHELLLNGKNLNDMATALLIRLRSEGERWSLMAATAGHPPAVLVSDEGTTLLGGGAILGAWEGAEPECRTATLSAGDTLVLCTDGWYEAGPPTTHEHVEALAELVQGTAHLGPAALTERLRLDVLRRSEGSLRDDVVVLAVRSEGQDSTGGAARRPESEVLPKR